MLSSSTIALDVRDRLAEVRRHLYKTQGKAKAYFFVAFIFALVSLSALLQAAFVFDSTFRTIIAVHIILLAAASGAWLMLLPLLRLFGILSVEDDFAIAKRVGNAFPLIRDRLFNFLQLLNERSKEESLYSRELLEASLAEIADIVRPIDMTRSVDESVVARSRKWFFGALSGSVLLVALFPVSMSTAYYRLAHFNREFIIPPAFTFEITPGNKEIVKGAKVEISVRLSSTTHIVSPSTTAILMVRGEKQERFEETGMKRDSTGLFRAILQAVKVTTEYCVRVSDTRSTQYTLIVLDRPILRSLKVRLEYPLYSKLPTKLQEDFVADVTALAGTTVYINGVASKDLMEAAMVFGRDSVVALKSKNEKFWGSFLANDDGTYYIELTDLDSLINLDPVRYTLKVIPDEYPTVTILEPGRNLDIAGDQTVRLVIRARDDFGFSQLRVGYRLTHSRYQQGEQTYAYVAVPIQPGQQLELEVPFTWNIAGLDLVPEDVVEYFAEVFDNDAVKGPKSAKSTLFLLRLPSLEEVFADLDKGHEQSIDEIKQAIEDAKKLKEDIESINQDMKKNKDIDWQKQKKMEEMAKQYQDVQKKLQNVEQQLDQMVQKMDQQNVLSKETMEKYMELQQLLQQLDFSELQKAFKQMQLAMQNVNKEQLQQAMQQVQFSEERFRQGLERTLDLLKRIQIEQKVDEVKKRAQELDQLQKDLKNEASNSGNDQQKQMEAAKKQEDLIRKEEYLEKESADLAKRMEEFFTDMPVDKLNALNQAMQQQRLGQKMKKAAQQMRSGQMQQAQQLQQQVQENLESFSQQMDALQQEMLQQQAQHVMNELRKATDNMLELSKREEALKQKSQDAAPNSPQLRQNAQEQQRVIQDLHNVINALSELSKKSFAVTPAMGRAIGEALARMENAMRNLDVRSGQMASQEQGAAMAALNKAAVQVQSALQAMMQSGQGGGAGSLMQQLQMMAGQQMSLNMKVEQMGQGMSMEQAAEMGRLAKEQDAIRKSLEQLQKEAQASSEQKKLLGDLEKISEDMKEVVRNLEQNNANPETLKKQERILSRLLDASKSMRERDYEKKRKAQTGTQIVRRSPKELDLDNLSGKNKLRDDLLKALEQGYAKDYQELIRKYFEELQKVEK